MKKITIIRSDENFEMPIDMDIIIDNKPFPIEFKKEQKEVSFELSNSEHAIQVGFKSREKDYRSNAYFFLGKKDLTLIMKKSSSRISLTTLKKEGN